MLYPLILGLSRIETTEPLRYNGVFHYLAGMPGYPDATTLRRFLARFAGGGRNSFFQLYDDWRAAMLGQPSQAILDLDSTVLTVFGRQERAEVGYNPKKRGRPSYAYQALVTNLPLQPHNLWRFYNRCARTELIIRELKYAYALARF